MKYCQSLAASYATPQDVIERVVLVDRNFHLGRAALENMGVRATVLYLTLEAFLLRLQEADYDVIFHYHPPAGFLAFYQAMRAWREGLPELAKRPLLVTGFCGITLGHIAFGLTSRLGSDVVCVNTAQDRRNAQAACALMTVSDDTIVQTGYPMAQPGEQRQPRIEPNTGRNIIFATQPHFPGGIKQRLYILVELIKLSRACPQDNIIIKLRMREGERTIHEEPYHYEAIFRALRVAKPHNLSFAYGDIAGMLDECDILLSMSSTAIVEGIAKGVPCAVIGDFGLNGEDGLPHFFESGLMVPIRDLAKPWAGKARPEWVADNGFGVDDNTAALKVRLDALLAAQEKQGKPLPLPEIYCTTQTLPFAFAEPVSKALFPEKWAAKQVRKGAKHPVERGRQAWLLVWLKCGRQMVNSLMLRVLVFLLARGYIRSGW